MIDKTDPKTKSFDFPFLKFYPTQMCCAGLGIFFNKDRKYYPETCAKKDARMRFLRTHQKLLKRG